MKKFKILLVPSLLLWLLMPLAPSGLAADLSLLLRAADKQDQPLTLAMGAISLTVDGTPCTINRLVEEEVPLLGIVLDMSASTQNRFANGELSAALRHFLESLQGGTRFFVVEASTTARLAFPPSPDKERLLLQLPEARLGGTALYDAIALAQDTSSSGGRLVLVVLADGDDNSSRLSFDQLEERLSRYSSGQTQVFPVVQDALQRDNLAAGRRPPDGDANMKRLAGLSGGEMQSVVYRSGAPELTKALERVRQSLRSTYTATASCDDRSMQAGRHKVKFSMPGNANARLLYRSEYNVPRRP